MQRADVGEDVISALCEMSPCVGGTLRLRDQRALMKTNKRNILWVHNEIKMLRPNTIYYKDINLTLESSYVKSIYKVWDKMQCYACMVSMSMQKDIIRL